MNVEIANKLVKLRKQMGLSQEELAEKIGVSRQAVSKWERSESSPDTDNLIALSKIYKISIDEMLDYDVDSSPDRGDSSNSKDDSYSYDDIYDEVEDEDEDEDSETRKFGAPIPIIVTIVYLALGLVWGLWHPGWLVFLLIPVLYFLLPTKVNGKWTIKPDIKSLPYPVFATFLFLLFGFLFDGWIWAWLIFLTIPIWAFYRKNYMSKKRQ